MYVFLYFLLLCECKDKIKYISGFLVSFHFCVDVMFRSDQLVLLPELEPIVAYFFMLLCFYVFSIFFLDATCGISHSI